MIYRLLILFLLIGNISVISSEAQNPKRTKKYKKKDKHRAKPSKETIEYKPRVKRDDDGDGVPNYYDHCANTPEGQHVTTFGCPPDTDEDGVYDFEDECIDVKGSVNLKGCPEPDTDGDGLIDRLDRCPNTPGDKKWQGCPDTDKDGTPDSKDNCVNEPGPKGNNGCPYKDHDTDGDGVFDSEDKCTLVPGPADNFGCPELNADEEAALKAAFENLLFETGKDVIKTSSFESLNKLAEVLVNNPYLKLQLEGHTDNVGDEHENMILSDNRAKATRNYLIKRGIKGDRISAQGYGETHPVADNETEEGRKQNRRVVMKLDY